MATKVLLQDRDMSSTYEIEVKETANVIAERVNEAANLSEPHIALVVLHQESNGKAFGIRANLVLGATDN